MEPDPNPPTAAPPSCLEAVVDVVGRLEDSARAQITQVWVAADRSGGDQVGVVVVGPERWHPRQRVVVVDQLRSLARLLGFELDVYPVRPRDVAAMRGSLDRSIADCVGSWQPIAISVRDRRADGDD